MKLATKFVAVLLAGASCGGLGMRAAIKDPEIGGRIFAMHDKIVGDVRAAIQIVTADVDIIWTDDANPPPTVTPNAVNFAAYEEDEEYRNSIKKISKNGRINLNKN